MPDWGEISLASKHLSVCLKNFFFHSHFARHHISLVEALRNSNQHPFASCAEIKKKEKPQSFLPWRHIWDINGLFMTLQFCPFSFWPSVVHCTVSEREEENGGTGSHRGAAGCLDEMSERRELLKEREMCWAEQSRAAVSLLTRAPTGVIEGFNFNYVCSAVVI